jgi:competence protein ComEC
VVSQTLAFALGIWAADQPDPSLPVLLVLVGGVTLALVFFLNRIHLRPQSRCVLAAVWLAWLAAGILRLGWATQLPSQSVTYWAGETVGIHGTVLATPRSSPGLPGEWLIRYQVAIDSIQVQGSNKLPNPATGGVTLTVRQDNLVPEAEAGDIITAAGKLRLFSSYHNPGQPDRRASLAAQGIDARLSLAPGTFRLVRSVQAESLLTRLARWRNKLRGTMLQAMPNQDAALIMGMLFGGYDGIERQAVRDFATTGIVHILSVSGAHIALLASVVFWLTGRLGVNNRCSALLAALAMLGYGFLSGFSAPVIRSVIMGLICLAALAMERRASAKRALALAVLGMLVYEPRNLFDISFQLSIGCTAGLLYLQPVLFGWMKGAVRESVTQALAATLAAQLAVIPFIAWYFGTFPLVSLLTNLLVAPLLEAVIILGLLVAILVGGSEPLARVMFVGVSLLLGFGVELNRFLCRLPGGTLQLPSIGVVGSVLYYAVLLWGCGLGERWGIGPGPFWRKICQRPYLSAGFGCLLVIVMSWNCLRPGPLQVHFIDVGQGDATLIITPHRRVVMVDTGGALAAQNDFDVGERVVAPYLRHYGVSQVDWLILTHNHQDHAGGAAAVASFIGVRQAVVRQEEPLPPAILHLQQAMQFRNLRPPDGLAEIQIDGVRFQLLQVGALSEELADSAKRSGKMNGAEQKRTASAAENGQSTVVRVEYGWHSFLLTGDLEGESEKKLMQEAMIQSTVLKVGHHGGRKSSQAEFLNRVTPQYAVVSVGADNRFGHPAPETLRRLTEQPVLLFRTDRDGAVVFCSDGKTLSFQRTVH